MELRQLADFVAVADEANFTRAAEKIHVAQPGVSAQIRRLEREFGQRLLDRSGRSVRLTAAGEAVLPFARAALAAVEDAKLAVGELIGLKRGTLSVGVSVLCSSLDVPGLLADFSRRHDGIEVNVLESSCEVLLEGVHQGDLDLAFIGSGHDRPDNIGGQVVADEPLVAVVTTKDPLSRQDSVSLTDLRDRRLICGTNGTGARATLDRAFEEVGIQPRISFESSDPQAMSRLAGRGFGVAVQPESLAGGSDGARQALPFEPPLRLRNEVIWRAADTLTPATRALVAFVLRSLDGKPEQADTPDGQRRHWHRARAGGARMAPASAGP